MGPPGPSQLAHRASGATGATVRIGHRGLLVRRVRLAQPVRPARPARRDLLVRRVQLAPPVRSARSAHRGLLVQWDLALYPVLCCSCYRALRRRLAMSSSGHREHGVNKDGGGRPVPLIYGVWRKLNP